MRNIWTEAVLLGIVLTIVAAFLSISVGLMVFGASELADYSVRPCPTESR